MAEPSPPVATPKVSVKPKRDALGKSMVGFAIALFALGLALLILALIVSERGRNQLLFFSGLLVFSGVALMAGSRP